ncbi:MAG: polysaccharide biosynthesis protein [Balneolia bacterium]|nr:polysaccharide biosynthesis protein [Balneolia bacterium]
MIHKLLRSLNNPGGLLYEHVDSVGKRNFIKNGVDFFIILACAPLAVLIRVGLETSLETSVMAFYTMLMVAPKLLGLRLFNVQRQSWHNVSIRDLTNIIYAVSFAFALSILLLWGTRSQVVIPWGVPFIDALLSVTALGIARVLARSSLEKALIQQTSKKKTQKRVIIIGAGSAGVMMAREMLRHPEAGLKPVVFLDDDEAKHKQRFFDIAVYGTIEDLEHAVKKYKADLVLTAIPSVPDAIRRVVEITGKLKVRHQILPRLSDLLNGKVSIKQMRDVDVQDLLQRKPVDLNTEEIKQYVTGKTILITGAGGSIGSEIVRQICGFKPRLLLLVGRGENSLYQLEQELKRYHSTIKYLPFVTDVRDEVSLERIFKKHRPELVFHAAAHKHVPLMEANPEQAVLNNVIGTSNLVELALKYDVERFVNISTDKAVNPTSVMGASKRVAEYVVESGAVRAGDDQHFVSVRFGNVLGSRGSVIPLFKEQIKKGGPVTVTDASMTRYFMTIPEASQLVLQAGGMDHNGAVYVLDMGEPVKIIDLARDLIKLSGLEPDKDVRIKITGSRPGEKLYEEILTAEEGTNRSKYEKIYMARKKEVGIDNLESVLAELKYFAEEGDELAIRRCFHEIIPNFTGYREKDLLKVQN